MTALATEPVTALATEPAYRMCPTPNGFTGASCKRRGCPVCGVAWARSVGAVIRKNLEQLGGDVVMISITPPGVEQLPWACEREHRDRHGNPAPCSGSRGCLVRDDAADEWTEHAHRHGWKKLRDAARRAVERSGLPVAGLVVDRVWEPQKRGVPHLHVISVARTPLEYAAANRFAEELERLAPLHRFGRVDRGKRRSSAACPVRNHKTATVAEIQACSCGYALPRISAHDVSRYLVSYLTGRQSRKKTSIRANISHPRMPRSLWWLTPALTSLSPSPRIAAMRERLAVAAGTGVTMRRLRYVRWYFAALQGRCQMLPRLFGQDLVDVALVAARLEPRKSRAPGETLEQAHQRHMRTLRAMRLVQPPYGEIGHSPPPRVRKINLDLDVAAAPAEPDPWMQLVLDAYASRDRTPRSGVA